VPFAPSFIAVVPEATLLLRRKSLTLSESSSDRSFLLVSLAPFFVADVPKVSVVLLDPATESWPPGLLAVLYAGRGLGLGPL